MDVGTTGGRYKIICHTVIVENRGAGIRVSYGQQWDIDSDGAVSHFYASSCLQCICTVLAIFYYWLTVWKIRVAEKEQWRLTESGDVNPLENRAEKTNIE